MRAEEGVPRQGPRILLPLALERESRWILKPGCMVHMTSDFGSPRQRPAGVGLVLTGYSSGRRSSLPEPPEVQAMIGGGRKEQHLQMTELEHEIAAPSGLFSVRGWGGRGALAPVATQAI
ncbi:hypothetical protein NDU88_000699 [Pleurodeles waltl]|uniref:Uncharacterized protein n=1 Tax=Pleurodeles waltl TaxID=8319 RepID=A0AAV7VUA6_PLEWA|nr:hypothetical protein NDU88_000699 [Pleurodeles waltl]